MSVFKCKICGGTMEVAEVSSVAVCDYCGTKQTIPSLNDEKRANLYERANHFRRINEFDKAMGIYEQILSEDKTDSEAYWSIVLCRYGIEYVEDPATGKRKPTVNRTQMSPVLLDSDYKYALQYGDAFQQEIYQAEALEIDRIQKDIFAIVQNEDPYDVFISYKEKTGGGSRTQSSVLAQDLYDRLTKEGFRVFFSRISLEDKIGQQYEPYIYSALNTSKVMLVIGTSKEEFNAPWVKNEWGRFLGMMKEHREKHLIPCFKDMDVYELPEELVVLQSQDMGKIGFEQDLIRGIDKIVGKGASKKNSYSGKEDEDIEALIRRAYQFVEDEDYNSAKNYCNRVLDKAPECGDAFLILYCAEMGYKSIDDIQFDLRNLGDIDSRIKVSRNLERALKFSDNGLYQRIQGLTRQAYVNHHNDLISRYNDAYQSIDNASSVGDYEELKNTFQNLTEYDYYGELKNELSSVTSMLVDRINEIKYGKAMSVFNSAQTIDQYQQAKELFSKLGSYYDSKEMVMECDLLIDQENRNKERLERDRKEAERRRQEEEQRREQGRRENEKRIEQKKRAAAARAYAIGSFVKFLISIVPGIAVFYAASQTENKYTSGLLLVLVGIVVLLVGILIWYFWRDNVQYNLRGDRIYSIGISAYIIWWASAILYFVIAYKKIIDASTSTKWFCAMELLYYVIIAVIIIYRDFCYLEFGGVLYGFMIFGFLLFWLFPASLFVQELTRNQFGVRVFGHNVLFGGNTFGLKSMAFLIVVMIVAGIISSFKKNNR